MTTSQLKQEIMNIDFDTTELNSQQIRLVKTINSMLSHVLTTDEESEYFDGSAELMKMVASAVKQSNFTTEWANDESIPYATQALEFCVDIVSDQIHNGDEVIQHDN